MEQTTKLKLGTDHVSSNTQRANTQQAPDDGARHDNRGVEEERFDSATIKRSLDTTVRELNRLRRVLDQLDIHDHDTGANALATVQAIATHLPDTSSVDQTLDAAFQSAVRLGVGNVGVLFAAVLGRWARAVPSGEASLFPFQLVNMLRSTKDGSDWFLSSSQRLDWLRIKLAPSVYSMMNEAQAELHAYVRDAVSVGTVMSTFSAQAQFGLVSGAQMRIDAGGAALAIWWAALDATIRQDPSVLESLATMLTDVAWTVRDVKPNPPSANYAFNVDIVLEGTAEDVNQMFSQFQHQNLAFSAVGNVDVFGVGVWHILAAVPSPLAASPPAGTVWRFLVRDSRPDQMLGNDSLVDVVTQQGVQLLERHSLTRSEHARVVAVTRAPGLAEDLARSGAVTLVNPLVEDAAYLAGLMNNAPSGVTLVAVPDAQAHDVVAQAAQMAGLPVVTAQQTAGQTEEPPSPAVIIADTSNDLEVLAVAAECGSLFIPVLTRTRSATLLGRVLVESAHRALTHAGTALAKDTAAVVALAEQATHLTMLMGENDDADPLMLLREQAGLTRGPEDASRSEFLVDYASYDKDITGPTSFGNIYVDDINVIDARADIPSQVLGTW